MSWGGGDILALSANNVQMGGIDRSKEAYFGSASLYNSWMTHGDCEQGDILLTMEAPLGNVAQVPDNRKYILSQRVVLIKPVDWVLRDFLAHYMRSSVFQGLIAADATGSTAKGIQRKRLDQQTIVIPADQYEQRIIAEALSDAEGLIESLERLIAKKRQIKLGAMQELLTGKRRLPGFEREWKVKPIGSGLVVRHGRSQHGVQCLDGAYPILASGGQIGRASAFLWDQPSVLIGRKGTIDEPMYMDTPFWTVDTLFYTEVRPGYHAKFLYYRSCLVPWRRYNEASGVPSLNAKTIEAIELAMPDFPEQQAIAAVLSDMDAEITTLESRLTKARQIKQSMMQQLLTGKIRLPVKEEQSAEATAC